MKKGNPYILFIAPFPPPVHGSAVVSQQIKESKLINSSFQCDWVNMSTSRRMEEIGKNTISKPFRLVGALCKTLRLLVKTRYDLCYLAITCHGVGFLKDAPFVLMCKLFGRNVVIHQHNKGMAKDADRWPYRWLLPLCYNKSKVILLSWHLYKDIEKVVPKENVMVCPNGIKVDCLSHIIKSEKEVYEVPRLLFLSNLQESKGVLVLLDALRILADRGVHFQCNFVGGETKEIDAKRFAEEVNRRQLNYVTTYCGKMYGKNKDDILDNSDVFVFPSYEDCFPLVLLEAMSHRMPIVTTTEGAIPDEVIDGVNGLICEKKDPHSLANCLEKLILSPQLRQEMGDNGYQILSEKFTNEIFEENMKEILRCCMN